jgi:hypothetical protein
MNIKGRESYVRSRKEHILEMCVDLHPFQIAVYIPSVSVLMVAAV